MTANGNLSFNKPADDQGYFPDATRLMIVSDIGPTAYRLCQMLGMDPRFYIAAYLPSPQMLSHECRRSRIDVVLMGHHLFGTGRSVFEHIYDLVDANSASKSILLSEFITQENIDRAIRVGARGIVSRFDAHDDLVNAIINVRRGYFAMSPHVARVNDSGRRPFHLYRCGLAS